MILDQITKPTLLLDEKKAQHHIANMAAKAQKANVRFRPHFKTHQSATVGNWFRDYGVSAITTSSVDMAVYFADHGWQDITIAFPLNLRQSRQIAQLAKRVTLHLLLDNIDAAKSLSNQLQTEVYVWLEIDAGYGRTGLPWNNIERITAVSQTIQQLPHLHLKGLLTHAGNSYSARGKTAVLDIHQQTVQHLQHVQSHLLKVGIDTEISIGDTPACSLADSFSGIDEIRPGNFIFYDMMQVQIGSCKIDDIAVYGGAVHLSKESMVSDEGMIQYGRIALPTDIGWEILPEDNFVYNLSQEHGLIQASDSLLQKINIGDVLLVLPIHSCLTANLLNGYETFSGVHIEMAKLA
jgi:D-serine deaminase-like pyridoxal phosphate-dependent protein